MIGTVIVGAIFDFVDDFLNFEEKLLEAGMHTFDGASTLIRFEVICLIVGFAIYLLILCLLFAKLLAL